MLQHSLIDAELGEQRSDLQRTDFDDADRYEPDDRRGGHAQNRPHCQTRRDAVGYVREPDLGSDPFRLALLDLVDGVPQLSRYFAETLTTQPGRGRPADTADGSATESGTPDTAIHASADHQFSASSTASSAAIAAARISR